VVVESEVTRDWLLELLDLTPIVLLSPEPDLTILNRLRQTGAGAFLSTTASADQILLAIKSVAVGLRVFDGALTTQPPDDEQLVEQLTHRESEVLRLLADGLNNRDIAARMNISEHTIKFHIRSILAKLGAATRTEAVTRGLRSGLIEL
jgi:DNA-binding NarL/FixJ family response regulator